MHACRMLDKSQYIVRSHPYFVDSFPRVTSRYKQDPLLFILCTDPHFNISALFSFCTCSFFPDIEVSSITINALGCFGKMHRH
jgi:hypothetical protein